MSKTNIDRHIAGLRAAHPAGGTQDVTNPATGRGTAFVMPRAK